MGQALGTEDSHGCVVHVVDELADRVVSVDAAAGSTTRSEHAQDQSYRSTSSPDIERHEVSSCVGLTTPAERLRMPHPRRRVVKWRTKRGTDIGQNIYEVGRPRCPDHTNFAVHGQNQRVLPQNVYAAFILGYMTALDSAHAVDRTLRTTGPPAVVTVIAQCTLAAFLYMGTVDADGDLESSCAPQLFWLQCAALSAFCCMAVREFIMALEIHFWLQMFNTVPSFERLRIQKYEYCEHRKDVEHNGKGPEAQVLHRPTTGLTSCARAVFYVLILLPNIVATALTLIAGSGTVLRAENRVDLVLNCVAAAFVLDLDDWAYALFLSRTIKNRTEGLPALNRGFREGGERARCCRKYVHRYYF